MKEADVLELFELRYSDLTQLSPFLDPKTPTHSVPSPWREEQERIETLQRNVTEMLGPTGPGILSITGVPNVSRLRRNLLPLARKLALLHHNHRHRIIKEHGLGTDVCLKDPRRNVSSFSKQLRYGPAVDSSSRAVCHPASESVDLADDEFKDLSKFFEDMGYCMTEIGLRVAQICDRALGGRELQKTLLESGAAKARLVHYHSMLDDNEDVKTEEDEGRARALVVQQDASQRSNLWQQWHYDYGMFTILTSPMFIARDDAIAENAGEGLVHDACAGGDSCLKIFDPRRNHVCMVRTSPESFFVQVGESADVLSRGELRSTLHCVCRPGKMANLSRETFVVFLQPAWSKTFSPTDCALTRARLPSSLSRDRNDCTTEQQKISELVQEIHKIVPPLSSRLKDGMTFAEFSQETTRQYFSSACGLQPNK